jgi:hypothetical protein
LEYFSFNIPQNYDTLQDAALPPDLVKRVVDTRLVTRLSGSPVFPAVTAALRRSEAELREQAANQLRAEGLTEAADEILATS